MDQVVVTPDSACAILRDSITSMLARTTLTLEDVVLELTNQYRSHLYIRGSFEIDSLGCVQGVRFVGTVCESSRAIAVF